MPMINRVEFISEKRACEITRGSAFQGIISITDPGWGDAKLTEAAWGSILRLRFHDIDKAWQNYVLISDEHADAVIAWLKEHEDEFKTVIVHCAAGISRSAAVAKFIAEVYDLDFPEDYFLYNKLVYSTLRKRFQGYDPVRDSAFRNEEQKDGDRAN
jgi:predicted protein tyrosine phosphatase